MSLTSNCHDFIDIDCLDSSVVKALLAYAHRLKKKDIAPRPLDGKTLALIFEKPSTRTRVSFEVGARQLGGQVTTLSGAEIQLGRGETIMDTGRVLSRFVDMIMIRTFGAHKLHELAEGASVPVINGLTDASHPCQVMADLMTVEERFGALEGRKVVWYGDGDNNVLTSWMHAALHFDFTLKVIAPAEFVPPIALLADMQRRGAQVTVSQDVDAGAGADVVITDCWVSMHNSDAGIRQQAFTPYQVNERVMAKADPKAIFMHCLPAHRGEEVTDGVIDSAASVVWEEAENRLHAQKAIMAWCMGQVL